jgi:L-lactate dehydrogenase complex protein LldF
MSHAQNAERFVADSERANWHDQSLWFIRQNRDRAASQLPEWEALREQAAAIKAHVLGDLDGCLERFEARALANGIVVHWAEDALAHNRIVHQILAERGALKVVKSKSMLTEECQLNPYLEQRGIEVIDTDLGERIVQMRDEPPSHIVMPAIHLKKAEIGELFHERLGTEAGSDDPDYLTQAARAHLREKFLAADAGITGVNFAVVETGGFVVVTNEGNADLGTSLPPLHIACMGLEKLVPRLTDLGVFVRLLARSATGQAISAYTSHFHGPRPGAELHLVIVDNGRSALLGRAEFRRSLACIRCGACMNTCPVYRRSGGHSYDAVVPGPIGSILAPSQQPDRYSDLPFASTLCGSCTDVCPVKIDLHSQLLAWRKHLAARGGLSWSKRQGMRWAGRLLARPASYRRAMRLLGVLRVAPRWLLYHGLNPWGRQRELPVPARQSFGDWYRENRDNRPSQRGER